MTAITDKLATLQEYADWRDQIELAGIDSSIDAYRQHLENRRAHEALALIEGVASKSLAGFSLQNPGDVAEALHRIASTARELTMTREEILPA